MKLVPESLNELQNFNKDENPLKSLDIGHAAKINRITSEDLELLNLYTLGHGKGNEDGGNDFPEIFGENEYREPLKRAREAYKLLEPYEYMFGDHFYKGMKAEMNEYIHNYLRNPNYDYAYDYFPMDSDEWHVFFSEIELPSAEFLGSNKRIK